MIRVVGHRGSRKHAPENSYQALICAYTSGADVIEFDLQLTADNRIVLSHDGDVKRLTGEDGVIAELKLADLLNQDGKFDFSKTFNPNNVDGFNYYQSFRNLKVEVFEDVLDRLPPDIELLIELKHDSTIHREEKFREHFVTQVLSELSNRGLIESTILYSQDKKTLESIREKSSDIRTAWFQPNIPADQLFAGLTELRCDGLVVPLQDVYNENHLTSFAIDFEERHKIQPLRVGLVIYPSREEGIFTASEFSALSDLTCVWSISSSSIQSVLKCCNDSEGPSPLNRFWKWIDIGFSGSSVDQNRWALGYAKANRWCRVTQDEGVHIETLEYDGWLPPDETGDEVTDALNNLQHRMHFAEKTWPYYSGGGVGLLLPINDDFVAEADYSIRDAMTQAQTLELAVVNVDPGRHQGSPPRSKGDTDTFYDPHGCPPYVGIEHDEDDGFRVNWNLGSEYESNQYGPPVGDGATPRSGTLRLERRGAFFAGYYKNVVDAPDWICVGAIKNLSLNQSVYLRCVAKRWRQFNSITSGYNEIQSNRFTFSRVRIFRSRRG